MWVSYPLDQHKALTSWYWTVHIQLLFRYKLSTLIHTRYPCFAFYKKSYLLANQRTRRRLLPVSPKIYCAYIVALHIICFSKCQTAQQSSLCLYQKFGKETSDNPISYKSLIDIGFQYLDHRLERHCSTNLNLRFALTQRSVIDIPH